MSQDNEGEVEKVEKALTVMKEINAKPESGIPAKLLKRAQAIIIVPNVIKGGFIVGGRHGKGIALIKDKGGNWSDPTFINLTGGSIGFQAGAQSIDVILVFKSSQKIRDIEKSEFTLGADAAVAAGPVGRQVSAGTDITMDAEVYSYSRSRGLFAGVSLDGSSLKINEKSNWVYYNKVNITADDIFSGGVESPASSNGLKTYLQELEQ